MSAAKRRKLGRLADKLEAAFEELNSLIEAAQDEYDSKSERWQESEKGEALRDWIDSVQGAADDLENCMSDVRGLSEGED